MFVIENVVSWWFAWKSFLARRRYVKAKKKVQAIIEKHQDNFTPEMRAAADEILRLAEKPLQK